MAKPNYRVVARQSASRYGLDPNIFERQIQQESGFRTVATSSAGAQGIAQIMPATARGWGVDPNDPVAALDAAAKNMAKYVKQYGGDYRKALAAYNAGPGAVQKYGGVPPYKETQDYVKRILGGRKPQSAKPAKGKPLGMGGEITPLTTPQTPAVNRRQEAISGLDDVIASLQPKKAAAPGEAPQLRDRMASLRETTDGIRDFQAERLQAAAAPDPHAGHGHQAAAGPNPKVGKVAGYKDILKLGSQFGLRIDGSNQTTGGRHAAGSYHYSGRAVDFGDAKNSPEKLKALGMWAKRNAPRIKEFYYGPMGFYIKNGKVIKGDIGGHDDHVHIAM